MTDPGLSRERWSFVRRRWPLLLVLLPLVLGAAVVAILGIGEYRCAREVQAEIARLRAAGEPVDDESMARWFQAGTSPEGTAAWRDILAAVSHVLTGETVRALPLVITYGLPIDLAPGGEWPDEPKVANFLQDVRPLIAQIEQAGKYPTPVWQPLAFHRLVTWVPEIEYSHLVMRLLSLEVKHALYRRDTERALRGLAAMQATAAAFDRDCFFVTDLYGLNLRDIHRAAIRRSLASTDWEPAQLDQLLGQLEQPRDVARRWHRIAAGERARVLAWMQSDRRELDDLLLWESLRLPAALLLTPSGTKRYLDHMAVLQRLGEPGILGLADRVQRWQQGWFESGQRHVNDALTDIFLPNVSAVAASHERDELDRRLTRTALGIRRYQSAEGRWPERLSDLAAVGLQASDWTALQAGPFGYQSDSAGAVLWAYDVDDSGSPSRIRSQLPSASEMAAKPGFWHVTRISPSGSRPEER